MKPLLRREATIEVREIFNFVSKQILLNLLFAEQKGIQVGE